MNNAKKTLLMVSGILSLIEGAGLILLTAFLGSFLNAIIDTVVATDPALTEQDIELIREQFQVMQGAFQVILAIFAVIVVLAGIFTLIAVSDPNKFERRKGLYVTGAVLTILAGPLSIPSILYYISFGLSNAPKNEQPKQQTIEMQEEQTKNYAALKDDIQVLRQLKEDGIITEEEFKKKIMNMLDKK